MLDKLKKIMYDISIKICFKGYDGNANPMDIYRELSVFCEDSIEVWFYSSLSFRLNGISPSRFERVSLRYKSTHCLMWLSERFTVKYR